MHVFIIIIKLKSNQQFVQKLFYYNKVNKINRFFLKTLLNQWIDLYAIMQEKQISEYGKICNSHQGIV